MPLLSQTAQTKCASHTQSNWWRFNRFQNESNHLKLHSIIFINRLYHCHTNDLCPVARRKSYNQRTCTFIQIALCGFKMSSLSICYVTASHYRSIDEFKFQWDRTVLNSICIECSMGMKVEVKNKRRTESLLGPYSSMWNAFDQRKCSALTSLMFICQVFNVNTNRVSKRKCDGAFAIFDFRIERIFKWTMYA